jgi:hypothetical protein
MKKYSNAFGNSSSITRSSVSSKSTEPASR